MLSNEHIRVVLDCGLDRITYMCCIVEQKDEVDKILIHVVVVVPLATVAGLLLVVLVIIT